MTKIEALKEYYTKSNELQALRGQEVAFTESVFTPVYLAIQADRIKLYEIQDRIEHVNKEIEKQKKANEVKAATEDYYKTAEGQAVRERISLEIANLCIELDKDGLAFADYVEDWCRENLGSNWQELRHNASTLEYGIVKDGKTVFGSDIEIYFGDRFGEENFTINVGTMGSFDPTETGIESRAEFYRGLAKFMSSPKLQDLKERCLAYNKNQFNTRVEIRKLENKIKNPLNIQ